MGKYLAMLDALSIAGETDSQPAKEAKEAKKAPLISHNSLISHPVALTQAVVIACRGLAIMPSEVLATLSSADMADFEAGLFPPAALRALADSLTIRRMVDAGQVPPYFTATATCRWCGPVFVSPAFAGRDLQSCCWCLNRHRRTPIPHPGKPMQQPSTDTAA